MRSTLAWTRAIVRATHDLTPTIRAFDLATDDAPRPFAPGSHVDLALTVGAIRTRP